MDRSSCLLAWRGWWVAHCLHQHLECLWCDFIDHLADMLEELAHLAFAMLSVVVTSMMVASVTVSVLLVGLLALFVVLAV